MQSQPMHQNQHYVPVFLLKNWQNQSNNGKKYIISYKLDVNNKLYEKTSKGPKYYCNNNSSWVYDSIEHRFHLENKFTVIDTAVSRVLRGIDVNKNYLPTINVYSVTEVEKFWLCMFILSLISRSLPMQKRIREISSGIKHESYSENGILRDVQENSLRASLHSTILKNKEIYSFYKNSFCSLLSYDITMHIPEGLLISDNPIVLCKSSSTGDIMTIVPISPTKAIIFSRENLNPIINKLSLNALNEMISRQSSCYVFSKKPLSEKRKEVMCDFLLNRRDYANSLQEPWQA